MWRVAVTILLLLPLIGSSQEVMNDSVIHLSEIQITSSRLNNLTTGLNVTSFDSLTLDINQNSNLSTLISSETPVYIKSYGPGNLSTISLRGTSSSHTGLYWNGIRLNPPNIDMEDLSLYPSSFFNKMSILKGGAGSLFGNGNVGGGIHLENNPEFKKRFEVTAGGVVGSYNDYSTYGSVVISNEKIWSKTQLIYKNALNNFPYEDMEGEIVDRTNASQQQYGFMQDIYGVINSSNLIGVSFWQQSSDRDIPASIQVPQSDAFQEDKSFRGMINWKRFWENGSFNTKAAYLYSYLYYFDEDSIPELQIANKIITNTAIGEFTVNQQLKNGILIAGGVNYRYDECSTIAYNGTPVRNTIGLFASINYQIPVIKWDITANFRQDFIDGYGAPFLPALGIEGRIVNFIYGKANISRNFRAPTFNDLYWYPYGNTSLKPEKSWNEEVSLIFKDKMKPKYELIVTGFNSVIDDYILWTPVTGNFWTAQNIQTVWARGLEVNGMVKVKLNSVALNLRLGYSYTKSTNQKQTGPNDNSINKQLIYIPVNNFTGNLSFLFNGFILNYRHSYTGLRFTTRDNEEYLPAYNIGDIMISKTVSLKDFGLKLQFDILNLYNTKYQSVAYYPMPGRNYRLSLYFQFKKRG